MRYGIIVAAALGTTAAMALSGTSARADDEYCGYAVKANAIIECGYSSATECENAIGKGGMCFVDPDYALDDERFAPLIDTKPPARRG